MTGPTLNNNPDQTLPTELRTIAAPVSPGIEELLHRIRILRDADTRLTRRLEDLLKLGPTDLAALQHVNTRNDENAPIRAADVSALLGITSAATTFLVSRLLKAGHLSREPDPTDKRAHPAPQCRDQSHPRHRDRTHEGRTRRHSRCTQPPRNHTRSHPPHRHHRGS